MARSIDKERCNEVHPAFIKIIEQLSPDEAMVMYEVVKSLGFVSMEYMHHTLMEMANRHFCSQMWHTTNFPLDRLVEPKYLHMYLARLQALSLLVGEEKSESRAGIEMGICDFVPSGFGTQFVNACIPSNFSLDSLKAKKEQPTHS